MTPEATETGVAMAAKLAPPASISIASIAGYQVSEVLIWATLVYTALLIGHKLYSIYRDVRGLDKHHDV